jgi:hypothetical protein
MTKEPYYDYFIRSQWHERVETPAAIGAKFLNTLDDLSRIDPIFRNWLRPVNKPGSSRRKRLPRPARLR